jgi:hypothetical protein
MKYKAANRQLKNDKKLLEVELEKCGRSQSAAPLPTPSENPLNRVSHICPKKCPFCAECYQVGEEREWMGTDAVTLSDEDSVLFAPPALKKPRMELLPDPVDRPLRTDDGPSRPGLFSSTYSMPAHLSRKDVSQEKAPLKRSNSGSLPFKLDAKGRLQGPTALGRKSRVKAR